MIVDLNLKLGTFGGLIQRGHLTGFHHVYVRDNETVWETMHLQPESGAELVTVEREWSL